MLMIMLRIIVSIYYIIVRLSCIIRGYLSTKGRISKNIGSWFI